ncbi:MAG: presqualene diphosphate synthase HpnD [Nitrospirae bacterium]|nr:presqualene diphosphate synthase HpnD [Nitrospirota bacterium]
MDPKSLTRKSGTNFYYAFALLPAEKRKALYALYNLCRRLDDAVDLEDSPARKVEALQTWEHKLEEAYRGRPSDPLLTDLLPYIERYRIPKQYFLDLIAGIEMDLYPVRFKTFDDLSLYCYRVASVVGLMSIEIFGYKNTRTRSYATCLGMALQLTNILRDLKSDIERGRLYLPLEDLERFGYSEDDLRASRYNDPFVKLMQFECQRAKDYYRKATEALPAEDASTMIAARAMGGIYRGLLTRIETVRYDVFQHPISLSKSKKLWIVLKTLISTWVNKG